MSRPPGHDGEKHALAEEEAVLDDDVRAAGPVLLAALRARDELDFARVAALADPRSLRERFDTCLDQARPLTLERFAARTTIVPERLEESFARLVKAGGGGGYVANSVQGISTYEELAALTPEEYLERFMSRWRGKAEIVRRLRERGRPVPPELTTTPPNAEYVVLGGVHESPDLLHLLYRTVWHSADATDVPGPLVRDSFRRQRDGSWRLLVDDLFLQSDGDAVVEILDEAFTILFSEDEIEGPSRTPDARADPRLG